MTDITDEKLLCRLEKILPEWRELAARAASGPTPLYLVGGALRDLCLGRKVSDLDFACPEADFSFWEQTIAELLGGHFVTLGTRAREFMTRRLVGRDLTVDLAALEGEALNTDLKRRDFTINAMALGLHDLILHDPCGGRRDLEKRQINAIAAENFTSDPLRIVRAARFKLEIAGRIGAPTRTAMQAATGGLSAVAGERLAVEFNHILARPEAAEGVALLAEIGALQEIFPALKALDGLEQNNYHHLDALAHTLAMLEECDRLVRENPFNEALELEREQLLLLKWAGLFHDTGKALTRTVDPDTGIIHFYGHERFSAHLARESLAGYALGKPFLKRLSRLIENHLRPLQLLRGEPQEKSRRRLVFDLGEDLDLLLLHALAALNATGGRDPAPRRAALVRLGRDLLAVFEREKENLVNPLLSGRDLIDMGMAPGPGMGVIIRLIHKKQIAGTIRNRREALAVARELIDAPAHSTTD